MPVVRAEDIGNDHTIYLPFIAVPEPSVWMGPGGGSIVSLAAHPNQPDVVFAGTLHGGVFKSSDRGLTWRAVNTGLGNLFIDSLAVDALGGAVYAGTHGNGVYKSVDGGETWTPASSGIAANAVVYTLAASPSTPGLVLAGTRIDGTFYTGILYRSLNGGQSWENVLEFSDGWVYSLAFDPGAPGRVLAAVHEKGPWLSTQNGQKDSWYRTTPPAEGNYDLDRWRKGRAVAFDPGGTRAHYSAWHNGLVSYSTNGGQNWWLANALYQAHVYPNGIAVHPQNGSIVYLADHSHNYDEFGALIPGSILKSANGGVSYWTVLPNKIFYSVAALPGETVLAGSYKDGLWRSLDGGGSWARSVQGLNNSRVTGMVFAGAKEIYASTTTGGGVYKSSDSGLTWTEFNAGLLDEQVNALVMHPVNPRILFALTNTAGLRKINLDGGSWSRVNELQLESITPLTEMPALYGLEAPGSETEIFTPGDEAFHQAASIQGLPGTPLLTLVFAPSDAAVAYLGSNGSGVYASFDSGVTWGPAGLQGKAVRAVAVHPGDASRLYAATSDAGCVWVSANRGANWACLQLPDSGAAVYALAVTASQPGGVYVGTSGGVYHYNGTAWQFTGLPNLAVTRLAVNLANPGLLLAGTPAGAYACGIDFCSWFLLDSQLSGVSTASINFNPADSGHVYTGTGERGTLRVRVGN